MPEIIPLGWFHTIMGIVALSSGGYSLVKFREILPQTRLGQIYLVTTLITAGTALAIRFGTRNRAGRDNAPSPIARHRASEAA